MDPSNYEYAEDFNYRPEIQKNVREVRNCGDCSGLLTADEAENNIMGVVLSAMKLSTMLTSAIYEGKLEELTRERDQLRDDLEWMSHQC